jgi:hypothetical protein
MRISSVIAGIVVSALIGVLAFVPYKRTSLGFRDVTGTKLTQTRWFGHFRKVETLESPLTKWCIAHGIQLREADRYYTYTTSGLLGVIGCGPLPASAGFDYRDQEIYLRWETEPAIKEFVAQMSVADETQKNTLVAAAIQRTIALERLHSRDH